MLEAFEYQIEEIVVVPGRGGVFEVDADATRVFSKKESGRHGEHDEIVAAVQKLLGAPRP